MKQKTPRLFDPGYLAFLRTKPCCLCHRIPSDAAHVRIGLFAMGRKPDDQYAVPLCRRCHTLQHAMNETKFWLINSADPWYIAGKLYAQYGGTGGKARTTKPKRKWPKRAIPSRSKR